MVAVEVSRTHPDMPQVQDKIEIAMHFMMNMDEHLKRIMGAADPGALPGVSAGSANVDETPDWAQNGNTCHARWIENLAALRAEYPRPPGLELDAAMLDNESSSIIEKLRYAFDCSAAEVEDRRRGGTGAQTSTGQLRERSERLRSHWCRTFGGEAALRHYLKFGLENGALPFVSAAPDLPQQRSASRRAPDSHRQWYNYHRTLLDVLEAARPNKNIHEWFLQDLECPMSPPSAAGPLYHFL